MRTLSDSDLDPDEPERVEPLPQPVLPTITALCTAMNGYVPEQHPAQKILLAARMLTTVRDWINPDAVVVDSEDYDYAGSEALDEIGIADICDPVRIAVIDRINHIAGGYYDYRIGHAIDAIARAHWEWRNASRPDTHAMYDPRIQRWITQARRRVVAAQRDYRLLSTGRAWIDGPEPEQQPSLALSAVHH